MIRLQLLLSCFLSVLSCGTYEPKSSQLQGLYDQHQILRLSQTSEKSKLYKLQVCPITDQGEVQESGCIDGLRSRLQEPVTLTLEAVSSLRHTREEQEELRKLQNLWKNYHLQMAQRQAGYATTGGLIVGAGAVIKKAPELFKSRAYIEAEEALLKEIHGQYRVGHQVKHQARITAAEELIQKTKADLTKAGLSSETMPLPLLNKKAEMGGFKQHILTDEFVEFFTAKTKDLLTSKNIGAHQALTRPHFFKNIIDYSSIAQAFLHQGHEATDIIGSQFYKRFMEFSRIESTLLGTTHYEHLKDALIKDAPETLSKAEQFVFHSGASPTAKNKVRLIKGLQRFLKTSQSPKEALNSLVLAKQKAFEGMTPRVRKGIIAITVGTIIGTIAILKLTASNIRPLQQKFSEAGGESRMNQLDVVVEHSFSLFNAGDGELVRLASVPTTLSYLGFYLKNLAQAPFEVEIHEYCYLSHSEQVCHPL